MQNAYRYSLLCNLNGEFLEQVLWLFTNKMSYPIDTINFGTYKS